MFVIMYFEKKEFLQDVRKQRLIVFFSISMNCEKEMNPPDLQRTVTNAVSRWPSSTWHRVSSHR